MDGWIIGGASSSAVSVTLGFSMFGGGDGDDGNDISCMCVCMCWYVCDSVSVVALDTHHHGHHHGHLYSRRLGHSFIQRDVGITHIHHQSMIHDP